MSARKNSSEGLLLPLCPYIFLAKVHEGQIAYSCLLNEIVSIQYGNSM
jgi:hypothetical protein